MSLDRYHKKRDFNQTPEPKGALKKSGSQLSFFIQKHHARRLHYDFRLELDGTLKSWALPKGPSLDPGDKRLAVHVEDHPLEYGNFEGEIPPKQYGAGHVLVWDRGVWLPQGDPRAAYRKGHIKFALKGEKLSGAWALIRMKASDEKKDNWLLIKEHDAHARSGDAADITASQPDGVLSHGGADVAKAGGQPRQVKATASKQAARKQAETKRTTTQAPTTDQRAARAASRRPGPASSPINLDGVTRAALPATLRPQLASLVERAPSGEEWLSEIKFDGYRALCRIDHGSAKLFTRGGKNWSKKWQAIADAAARLPVTQAWLDGEVVAIDAEGKINFQLLQSMDRGHGAGRLAYYVFDLLHLDGHDLRQLPLVARKQLLQALLEHAPADGPILFSEHLSGNAPDVFAHACRHGLEGIICKRADAAYASERNRHWLKVKCQQRQEFVIGGYTDPAGTRQHFGALLLGTYYDRKLRYAGRVGTGFDQPLLASLAATFKKLTRKTSPFSNPPQGREASGVHWLQPTLVAEVRFAQWTEGGIVRHASFVGLRRDKAADDVVREQAAPPPAENGKSKNTAAPADKLSANKNPRRKPADKAEQVKEKAGTSASKTTLAGVRLTHPARVLFPDIGLTKLQLAQYYRDVAEYLLPHLEKRPLTLVRCPHGDAQPCFFQKHANQTTAKEIGRVEVPRGAKTATYLSADSLPALLALVQMGVLELHTWGARSPRLDQPDRMIFDLDPAPDVAWPQVVEAAQLVRALLQETGLASFVKTTGGKGLHVVVPIKPEHDWPSVKAFTRAIAEHLAQQLPDRFTANMSKAQRGGKIFIDYLRNAAEATAVAAYSSRARPGAPVSMPIEWEELADGSEGVRSDTFNVLNIAQRLHSLQRDPWAEYFSNKQRLSAKAMRMLDVK